MAGTTRLTAGNVKPGTAAREVQAKKMVDTGIVGVDASPTLPHDRDAVHVELYVVGITAAVVAEEAAKLHAQLGQDAIDVPVVEIGPDVALSEEAERE